MHITKSLQILLVLTAASGVSAAMAQGRSTVAMSLFGVGLLGASLLAAGVLPLATAYSVAEAFGFQSGGPRRFFYEEFEPGHHAVNLVELVTAPTTKVRQ